VSQRALGAQGRIRDQQAHRDRAADRIEPAEALASVL